MQIAVKANSEQKQVFLAKGIPADIQVSWLTDTDSPFIADAYFDLCFEEEEMAFPQVTDRPVFINAVIETNSALPCNCIRINAWNSFWEKETIEIVAGSEIIEKAVHIIKTLGWKYQLVPDIPGMISARVIAMIVNEAYFGLGDEISTPGEIDIAMKLGTNYPLGPFEWSEKIGLLKIYTLLKKLSEKDSRYNIAPALEKEIQKRSTH